MRNQTFHITGRIIDRETGRGVPALRVEAWDKDLIHDDFVGRDVTDTQGHFHMAFEASHFQEMFHDRRPDLFFRVFHGDTLIGSTEDSVLWNVEAGDTAIVIEVDAPLSSP